MSIAVDGFKVFRRIGDAPDAFQTIRVDVDNAARSLVVKCLKAKATGIDALRNIHAALHDKQFHLVIDGLSDAEIKSLVKRLDKHHPDLKAMPASDQKQHLMALAGGRMQPATPVAKAKKSKKTKKADGKSSKRLQFESVDAFVERREAEED